jgi:undecaprenyl-diphosphatase
MSFILFVKVLIISLVEGLTEFIPVSSTGHMIIVDSFINMGEEYSFTHGFVEAFQVIIQLGAILSVVVLFFNDLNPFTGNREESKKKWKLLSEIFVALIPAAVLGYLFDDYISEKLFNYKTVSIALIFYGVILIFVENFNKETNKLENVDKLNYKKAFIIGLFQCLAMVPGTSRSASTIIGGMFLGLGRAVAAEFSFFLAIPTMFGASLLKIMKLGLDFSLLEWQIIAIGFTVSFIVAIFVIRLFMNYIKSKDFKFFGVYRIVLGILVLMILN